MKVKSLSKSLVFVFSSLIFSYQAFALNSFTPLPGDLLIQPSYIQQVLEIDDEREVLGLDKLSKLILESRVTKKDNGSAPYVIVVDRIRPEEGEFIFDGNGELLIDPLHDKVEVEEYYVLAESDLDLDYNSTIGSDLVAELEQAPLNTEMNADHDLKVEPVESDIIIDTINEGEIKLEDLLVETKSDLQKSTVDLEAASKLILVNSESDMAADWDERKDGSTFTKLTLEALEKYGKNLLDPNLKMKRGGFSRYCKRYNSLDREERKQFWLMFISGLTRMESGFRSSVKYRESFSYNGSRVYSRGLLQMSIASVNQSAYSCNVRRAQDLHDPKVNLSCAVKIMNYWIKRDRAIYGIKPGSGKTDWLGVANYWSPIRLEKYRGSKKSKHERLGHLINSLDICR